MKPLTGLPVDAFVKVSREADIPLKGLLELVQQVENGASPAFLARYRADVCAGLDEERVRSVLQRLQEARDLVDHRISMVTKLRQRGVLTPELEAQLESAADRRELNDIFTPFRPRKPDAADAAIESGLDPLARVLWFQQDGVDIEAEALKHVDADRGIEDAEQAYAGAYKIAARWLSEKPEVLRGLRKLYRNGCELSVKLKPRGRKDPRAQTLDGYRAKAAGVPWQKRLAIRRGVRTGLLEAAVEMTGEATANYLESCLIKDSDSPFASHLKCVVSYAVGNGLLERVKRDALADIDAKADSEAIKSFRKALRAALLAPTAHGKRIVGIETGRNGDWRVALIDGDGELVDCAVVPGPDRPAAGASKPKPEVAPQESAAAESPNGQATASDATGDPQAAGGEADATGADPAPAEVTNGDRNGTGPGSRIHLCEFLRDRDVDLIVYPSGPRPLSTERFIRSHIRRCGKGDIAWHRVRDSRTWTYATSKAAKREFPRLEPASRSAISLARRVQDPMAELVKTDPRSLGIGPNHYEVNSGRLRPLLRQTVECVVHEVGVDANRAPIQLLAMVPGFTDRLARRIVEHRNKNGPFQSRRQLNDVDGVTERAFAQAVGFLRVRGNDPLDDTGAHPEYGELHQRIAEAAGCDLTTLLAEPGRLDDVELEQFATEERPLVFVRAVIDEFLPARRKPRGEFEMPKPAVPLRTDQELQPGSKVEGVVSNTCDYGAWVDIGGDQDALLHVSQIHREHKEDSKPAFASGDLVDVYIRPPKDGGKRISLTMWKPNSRPQRPRGAGFKPGAPRPFGGRRDRRRFSGRERTRAPVKRTFGPQKHRRASRRRAHASLTMAQKLDLLQDKYRTKVE